MEQLRAEQHTIESLFATFYVVPDYQREYVWKRKQVQQLIDDIHAEFVNQQEDAQQYFVGTLVVCPMEAPYELVDGQQRVTTLLLMLCAIRDHIRSVSPTEQTDNVDHLLAATGTGEDGRPEWRQRVELQYADAQGVLQLIAGGDPPKRGSGQSARSSKLLVDAYYVIRQHFDDRFGADVGEMRRFFLFLIRKVSAIRVETASRSHAIRVFETINHRGLSLQPLDLLRNLVFSRVDRAEYGRLKTAWGDIADTLEECGERNKARFLRYFVMGHYACERVVREAEVYDWFREHADKSGISNAVAFTGRLQEGAKRYASFARGCNADGQANRYLTNIQYLSGQTRMHLILLLSARKLSSRQFTLLCDYVERLYACVLIPNEGTRELEPRFAEFANRLRNVSGESELNAFLDATLRQEIAARIGRVRTFLQEADGSQMPSDRLHYVLAKLTQFVDEQAKGSRGAAARLETYVNGDVEVEHILPRQPSDGGREPFEGRGGYDRWVARLGNLALLERPHNRSAGNKPFADKRSVLAASGFLLTSSIAEPVSVGKNTSFDRLGRRLKQYDTWLPHDIETRQKHLASFADEIWGPG